jgi:hypothetical protein
MFQVDVLNVSFIPDVCCNCLSRRCKSGSRCCIYMYVSSFFSYFILIFASVSSGYICFLGIFFVSVSDSCFKCFICLLLYVAIVAFGCFKSRSGVAHENHVGSSWRRGRCSGWREATTGVLACEPNVLGTHSIPVRAPSGC